MRNKISQNNEFFSQKERKKNTNSTLRMNEDEAADKLSRKNTVKISESIGYNCRNDAENMN